MFLRKNSKYGSLGPLVFLLIKMNKIFYQKINLVELGFIGSKKLKRLNRDKSDNFCFFLIKMNQINLFFFSEDSPYKRR